MKTFECQVFITVLAETSMEAVAKVDAALDYMLEVSNDDGDLITAAITECDEVTT